MVPLPVLAADSASPPSKATTATATETSKAPEPRTLRAALDKIDARDLQPAMRSLDRSLEIKVGSNAPRRADQGTNTAKQSASFFKTGPGIAVLAAFAAGVSYALYSTSHDRIHSPGRE
jgi:hypothetical protein